MNSLENSTQPDFRKLAGQYASFFTALAGVCITVLTLILAIQCTTQRAELHSVLVASLVVATLVSFIGAHLMAETAACFRQPTSLEPLSQSVADQNSARVGRRLFLLASTNIYLGVILTSFSLMLLPAAYDKQNDRAITGITLVVFLAVVISALLWMRSYFASRITRPDEEPPPRKLSKAKKFAVWAVSGVATILILIPGNTWRIWMQTLEFIVLVCLSAASGFYFIRIYHPKQESDPDKSPQSLAPKKPLVGSEHADPGVEAATCQPPSSVPGTAQPLPSSDEKPLEPLQPKEPKETKQPDGTGVPFFFFAATTFSCVTILTLGLRLILPNLLGK